MSAAKYFFAKKLQEVIRHGTQPMDYSDDLVKEYWDMEYYPGGANEITDEDVASLNLNAADIPDGVTYLEDSDKFHTNRAVVASDRSKTVNSFRRGGNG